MSEMYENRSNNHYLYSLLETKYFKLKRLSDFILFDLNDWKNSKMAIFAQ